MDRKLKFVNTTEIFLKISSLRSSTENSQRFLEIFLNISSDCLKMNTHDDVSRHAGESNQVES